MSTTPEPQPDDDDDDGDEDPPVPWYRRFPALLRLGEGAGPGRIPFIQQLTATECGAACLAMVLGYHGKSVRLDEVRDVAGVGRDGTNAQVLLDTAHVYGLRGRGVQVDLHELEYLDPGTILHWDFSHFVVFERLRPDAVEIVDPALGRRRVAMSEFRRSFTGVALLLEPGEDFAPTEQPRSPVWRHLVPVLARSGSLPRVVVTSLLLQLFALAVPALTGALVDRVVPRGDRHLLIVLSAGLASLVAFHFLASLVRAHLLLHLRTLLDARMTLDFLDHLVDLPYAFFQRRSAGDLMMRLNSNTTIREILTSGAISGLLDGTLVTLYLALLFFSSPAIGLLVLALGVAQIAVFLASRRRQRELMTQHLVVQARSHGYEVEMLSGIETLKALGSEQRSVEHWSHLFVDELNVSLERGRLQALVDALGAALRLGSPLIILAYGALLVLDGRLSLGTMLGLSALAGGFLVPLASLVETAGKLQLLSSYVERIDDVLDTEPEQVRANVRPAPALTGRIQLDQVSFRYGPLSPLVVRDVSIDVHPGQLVAIVGRSGSGKSTLACLLVGLYRPVEGRILYDGADLAELDVRSVRRQVGMVTQRPYLFGTSVRAYIALADPMLPHEAIERAARLACVHDDIMAMPMGYESPLIDGGASISGGQRQRLALARALVERPAILLLDEATSALDAVTEAQVQESLASLKCTRVVIAHRLSTVRRADLILVMDGGRLVEQGTHDQLLARDGVYARLVDAQLDATPAP
jgi:ABC-type bacteriocin/lantibiotic exporter with double-glycine peptidase domain